MTKTLLELAHEVIRLRGVMNDCLPVEYSDATDNYIAVANELDEAITPERIIELCEALEGLLNCPESAAAVARARAALPGKPEDDRG